MSHATLLHTGSSQSITLKSRSNFSSSFLFLSPKKRVAMRRVYAFFRVMDDVVDEEPNPVRKAELLSSWKRELLNTYKGIPIVPLLKELKESIDHFEIPQDYFLKLIEGCEMDMTKNRYASFNELYKYCYCVASMVGLVCMKIFEYHSPTSEQAAIDLGIALQLTNIIRDVGIDYKKGRVYLPQDEINQFHVTPDMFEQERPSAALISLLQFQDKRAISFYEKGCAEFQNDKHGKLLPAKIMATVYRKILNKIRRQGYPVLQKKVGLNFFEKATLLASILGRHTLHR